MTKQEILGLATVLLTLGCSAHSEPPTAAPDVRYERARPGDEVRVVRFNVKPDGRDEFEEFFWHSLKPAASKLQPDAENPVGSFRLWLPSSMNRNGYFTYYVMVDPIQGDGPAGEAMRDMVRRAFPGADGQERVRRWMTSIVLGEEAPEGEQFIEADLAAADPPD
jgi:hypothetical protein